MSGTELELICNSFKPPMFFFEGGGGVFTTAKLKSVLTY